MTTTDLYAVAFTDEERSFLLHAISRDYRRRERGEERNRVKFGTEYDPRPWRAKERLIFRIITALGGTHD